MAVYTQIDNPELFFQAQLFSGNGTSASSTQSITFDGDENLSPNLVWFKKRSGADDHELFDSVRGVQKALDPNNTNAEASGRGLTAFNSDGFTVGNGSSAGNQGATNENGHTFVTWNWKESATSGFDIVSYAGNGSAARELAHSLSATPHFIIVKNRDDAVDWFVYHQGMTDDYNNKLNTTDAEFGGAYIYDPTSSIFKLRDHNVVNDSGDDYIAYAWSEKQGFSKFSSFVGSGSSDGPFCFCGFKVAWLMIKRSSDGTNSWEIRDNKRDSFNTADDRLFADLSNAEDSDNEGIDFLSNGFKIRNTGAGCNASGVTYIYAAFAEAPFVNSNGVPCNAR